MKTKNSTFKSLIALLLCVAMLAGTTYAWFTDVATSKDNVIQAGELDVTMEWANSFDASTWQDATQGAIFTHNNWEPGYTDVKYIKISNKGDLNLKWRLSLEAEGTVTKLADVIGVYYINPATGNLTSLDGLTGAGKLTNVLNNTDAFAPTGRLVPEASVIVAIAMHMDEEAGNEYKGLSLCNAGFSVKLVATQDVGESDSFGDQYDNNAEWPEFKMNFAATASLADDSIERGYLIEDVVIRHNESGAYAIVPAGTKLADGTTELKFTGKNVNANGNFADPTTSYDIHIAGIAEDNDKCITVFLGKILEAGLGATELKLYHESEQMTRVNSVEDFAINNQYTYDEATGAVVLYVNNFSVFSAVKASADVWDGVAAADSFASGTGTEADPFIIKTAAQLVYFRNQVDAGNSFTGQYVKLDADIDLDKKLFDPIGFGYTYNKPSTTAFMGTFDGGNHTIYNLYQNGWDLDEDKVNYSTYTYSTAGGGLFASIENATIKNLAVSGADIVFECVDIGIVVGYAQGNCHFENIIVTNSTIANYNRATGGVVGEVCYGSYGTDVTAGYSHTFKNIVVDSSVVVSSLWGSFDTLCGGVIGGKWGDATVKMENIIAAAELDVYSDVTAAYQWYAYRRCGMLIGHTEQNSPKKALNAAAEFLTCENVTVYYGDWVNYDYYQFANQDSGTGRNYPWVRAEASPVGNNGAFSNPRYGVPAHDGVKVTEDPNMESLKTDYTPIIFNQLYGGGQGVYGCNEHAGVTTINKATKTIYFKNDIGWENLKLYYWFVNGDDTWTTLIDGIALTEKDGVYRVELPAYANAFKITADGENATPDIYVSEVIDGVVYDLNGEHTHEYQWVIDVEPTVNNAGVKHEQCTGCREKRNENTPIAQLTCTNHKIEEVGAQAATCLEKGNAAYYTCLTCGRIYADVAGYIEINEKDYEIPSLGGHNVVDGICQNAGCGENFNRTIALMNGNTVFETVSGVVGEEIPPLSVPQKANYYFDGWYTDSACNNLFKETTFSEDVTLYAKWVAINTTKETLTIMSLNAEASNALADTGKVKKAVTNAGVALGDLPDIICLQNLGANWYNGYTNYTTDIPEYTAHYHNRYNSANTVLNAQGKGTMGKHFIYYKTGEFSVEGGGCNNYLSYIVLKRLSDNALFVIVNVWSYTSDEASIQAELNAIRDRINGTWADANRGLIPIIIAGSFYQAPEESIVYQDLTEDSQFFDVSNIAKENKTPGSTAATGDYIFVSYHMQSSVENYGLINTGSYPALYASLAFQKESCSHLLTKTEAIAATCETAGNKEYYTCSFCGKLFADELAAIEITEADYVIPALGHKPGAAATCESAQTCIRCDYVFKKALGHAWTNGCDTDCNNSCGETREITHDYQWVVDDYPTYDSKGSIHEECTRCHGIRNENTSIDKLTKVEAIAPTCLTMGNKEYYISSVLGKVYSDAQGTIETTVEACAIAALGHNYQWVVDMQPTLNSAGVKHEECTLCHEQRNKNTPIDKLTCLNHNPTFVEATDATCTTAGNKAYYACSTCSKVYTNAEGSLETTISKCTIPAFGHNIVNGKCTICNQVTITFQNGSANNTLEVIPAVFGIAGNEIPEFTKPTLDGYTFEGWYRDKACTILFAETIFSESLTLYAKFVPVTTGEENQMLTMVSLNVNGSNSANSLITSLVNSNDKPDIISLQEAGEYWRKKENNANSILSGYYGAYWNISGGNVIFINTEKLEWVTSTARWISDTYTDEFGNTYSTNASRYVHYFVVRRLSDDQLFAIINIQLDNDGKNSHDIAEKIRQAEIEFLMRQVEGIWGGQDRGTMPIIITGDFNSTSDDIAYKSLTETYGFFDSSLVANQIISNNATTGDYIFVSSHLQYMIDSYEVKENSGSDHNAILLKFTLPEFCSHNFRDSKTEAVAATCTTAGNKEYYTCSKCHKVYADIRATVETTVEDCFIPALGHNWVDATCEAPKSCSNCGTTEGEALGHAWTNACDIDCNNSCGAIREITHDYQWVVDKAPTVASEGVKHEQCTVCQEKRNENTPIDKLLCTHTSTIAKVEAIATTCKDAGNKEYYRCSACNKTYSDENGYLEITEADYTIPALPHTWVDATCVAPKTCSACDATEGDKSTEHVINAEGVCDVCKETQIGIINLYGGQLQYGTYSGDNAKIASAVSGLDGEKITLPTPTLTGHTFGGWYSDYACTEAFQGETFVKGSKLTLYAKWTPNTDTIKVMSFNVKTDWYKGSRDERVVATIQDNMPDVVCVQEADSGWMSILNDRLPKLGYTAVSQNKGRDGGSSGEHTAIFYKTDKFTAKASGTKWLSNTPDTEGSKYSYKDANGTTHSSNYPRIMTYVVLERKSDGGSFLVVNTHLDNNGNNAHEVAEVIRQAEVDIMMKIIKSITDSRGNIPVIVTGDFNVIRTNRSAYTAMTSTYGYSDSAFVAKQSERDEATYNGMGEGTASILDYIFVSSHMKNTVTSYTVCDAKRDGEWISDHNAIISVIEMPYVKRIF